ncbi:MAG: MutS family DNA mismatch repair protein [Flammeovirgaceae bacterium]
MKPPIAIFEEKFEQHQTLAKKFHQKSQQISIIRFVCFLIVIAISVFFANQRQILETIISLATGSVVFIWLLQKHSHLDKLAIYHDALKEINHQEISRLKGEWEKITDVGKDFYEAYVNAAHPYVKDLDVFGKQSLFQWLNRTSTPKGRLTLAEWLVKRADFSEILLRQEAIRELRPQLEYRQDIQAIAKMFSKNKFSESASYQNPILEEIFKETEKFSSSTFIIVLSFVLPVIFLIAFALFVLIPIVPFYVPLFFFLVNLSLIGKFSKTTTRLLSNMELQLSNVGVYHQILKKINEPNEVFQSEMLKKFQSQLREQRAIEHLEKLSRILDKLSYRQNALFTLTINTIFVLELHWMRDLSRWYQQHAQHWNFWMEMVATLESLNSLAGAWYANPELTLPNLVEKGFLIEGVEIGHPLITITKRICNDFRMTGNGKTYLLTGPNMAGKSTFLRTLGINAVLAFAGASVCAKSFKISQFDVFTSMRIEDSLSENISSFYAELKRIRLLFDFIDEKKEVFYLLDELLRGTNSKDRHEGVKIIIKRLNQTICSGLIATHDLALAEMQQHYPQQIDCYCFDSTITEGKVIFDYKLKRGVSSSYSATTLMKNLGIY